jgi:hypothetical protein
MVDDTVTGRLPHGWEHFVAPDGIVITLRRGLPMVRSGELADPTDAWAHQPDTSATG